MPTRKAGEPELSGRAPWVASITAMVADTERSKSWYAERLGLSIL